MVGLPALAAYVISTPPMLGDLGRRAAEAAAGVDSQVKIEVDGRDVTVSGDVQSQAIADSLLKALANTYGIRVINQRIRIKPQASLDIPEAAGSTMFTYLGAEQLTTRNGRWSLATSIPLSDNEDHVMAVIADTSGNPVTAES
jgi:hypothetical protein